MPRRRDSHSRSVGVVAVLSAAFMQRRAVRKRKAGLAARRQPASLRLALHGRQLERKVDRQLQDARRVCVRDLAEGGIRWYGVGIEEFGVIEQVERVAAEFDVQAFGDAEVLRERQVEVGAAGSPETVSRVSAVSRVGNLISRDTVKGQQTRDAEIGRVEIVVAGRYGSAARIIQRLEVMRVVGGDVTGGQVGVDHACVPGAGRARITARGAEVSEYVQGEAGSPADDGVQRPAGGEQLRAAGQVMGEGKLPPAREHQRLAHVEIAGSVEQVMVVGRDHGVALAEAAGVIQLVAPCIPKREEAGAPAAVAARQLLTEVQLERIIVRFPDVLKLSEVTILRAVEVEQTRVGPEDKRVYVHESGQLVRVVTDVANLQREAGSELLLNREVVLEHVRRA